MNSAGRLICGMNKFDHIRHGYVINYTGCQFHNKCTKNFVCFLWTQSSTSVSNRPLSACFFGLWQKWTAIGFNKLLKTILCCVTPSAWNLQLPSDIRNLQLLESFKSGLQIYLFGCTDCHWQASWVDDYSHGVHSTLTLNTLVMVQVPCYSELENVVVVVVVVVVPVPVIVIILLFYYYFIIIIIIIINLLFIEYD